MHTALGIGFGFIFVVGLLALVAGGVTLMMWLKIDRADFSIGAFGSVALLFIAMLVSFKFI